MVSLQSLDGIAHHPWLAQGDDHREMDPDSCFEVFEKMLDLTASDFRAVPEWASFVFVHLDPTKIPDEATAQKAARLAERIRGQDLSHCAEEDFIEFLPSHERMARNLLYFDSLYFKGLFNSKLKEAERGFRVFEGGETESEQREVLSYLRKSRAEREVFVANLTPDAAAQLLFISAEWQVASLIEAIDKVLVEKAFLDEGTIEFLGNIDLSPYPKLWCWLFLCHLFAHGKPIDEEVQDAARASLIPFQEKAPTIKFAPAWIDFLLNTPAGECPPLEFDLEDFQVNDENFNGLLEVGQKLSSIPILLRCLEYDATQRGITLKSSGDEECYIVGWDPTNKSKRNQFQTAPCPAENIQVVLYPKQCDGDFWKMMERYSALSLGVVIESIDSESCSEMRNSNVTSPIKLVSLDFMLEINTIDNVLSLFPELKIVVFPEQLWGAVFAGKFKGLLLELARKRPLDFWKTLSGTEKLVQRGVHEPYDCLWRKVPSCWDR